MLQIKSALWNKENNKQFAEKIMMMQN